MWKFISRGFKETFERGLNFGRNNNVRVPNETQRTKYYQDCANTACFIQYYQIRRKCKKNCNDRGNTNEKGHRSYGTQDAFDSWLGAVSCSSAIALGWILSQPCHWKKWFVERQREKKNLSLVECLAKVAFSQPLLTPTLPSSSQSVTSTSYEDDVSDKEYGPQTPEEALNEAADNFLKVHNNVFGEIENKKAISFLEGPKKDERKAVQLFYAASKKGYIPAAYNLGQCYELGIGTKQDFHEAAKWYQKAADGGHPNATYNLAVFYAHGWGGLEADTKKTRKLLEVAASLGQPDAAAALGVNLVKDANRHIPDIPGEALHLKDEPEGPPLVDISIDPNELFKLASSFENSPCEDTTQPQLVLQLYKMASDLGHAEARSKYKLLQAYDTVGLLTEYLCRGSKPSDCYSRLRFPTVF